MNFCWDCDKIIDARSVRCRSCAYTGRKLSPEHIEKISKSHLGKKCGPMSLETKRKISKGNTGKIRSEEVKRRISKKLMNNCHAEGYTHTEEAKQRMREMKIDKSLTLEHRIKMSLAKGGDGNIDRLRNQRSCPKDIRWKKKVYKRDNFICQRCDSRGGSLNAHHIYPWESYPALRHLLVNGVTLCKSCHDRTKNKERHWIKYFKSKGFALFKKKKNLEYIKKINYIIQIRKRAMYQGVKVLV